MQKGTANYGCGTDGAVWLALLPFVLGQGGLGLLPFTLPDVAFIVLFIGGTLLGPTGGALVVTAAAEGRPGVRRFLRRYVQWRVGIQWYALTLVGYFALYLVAAVIAGGLAPLAAFFSNWTLLFSVYPAALLSMILFPALIEEPGWRGDELHRALGIIALRVMWTWVVNHAKGSILIAILLHAASNATGQVFEQFVPGLPAQFNVIGSVLVVVSAALLVVATRGQLGYAPERAAL